MRWSSFVRAKAACAYFYIAPGLVYGMFTSRMPALKEQTGANEAEIGFILLCFGLCGLAGLLACAPLIRRYSSRSVLRYSTLAMILSLPLCALATSPLLLALACVVVGLSIGLADVAMNTQAIQLEHRLARPCLALMHAGYSLGGVLGALSGALFAALGCQPFWNFVIMLGLYATARPWCVPRLQRDKMMTGPAPKTRTRFSLPPVLVLVCGLIAACAYAAEGTVGEWGALYLFGEKGASEQMAALVYACFSVATVSCRMVADIARTHFEDFSIALSGSLLAFLGMALVLNAASPVPCLVGYFCMGLGMAPIVPMLFSRAGSCPGVSASTASAVVSILAYGGLLLFPPLIGSLAHAYGLHTALHVALGLCGLLVAGSLVFRKRRK